MMDMPTADILNLDGEKTATRDLPADVFDVTARPIVLAQAVRYYRNRRRAGTASTKDRSQVRGSGRKLYAQKHTGRARHADAQAPQFRGGGRAHGSKPHRASIHLPHRVRRLALRAALSDKLRDGRLKLLALPSIEQPSTKLFRAFPQRSGLSVGRILFVFDPDASMAYQSVINIPNTRACRAMSLTAYDVMASRHLVLTEKSADLLAGRLSEAARG